VTPRIDDPDEVQLDAPRLQTLQQADATTEHHRHQIDDQLVQQAGPQALLHQLRRHDEHIPPRGSEPRPLDRALDTLGDKRVRRIARRH
jgi:hypothetical protein